MESNEEILLPQTNKHSIISLILGVLTLLMFCSGLVMPIPFIGFICFPSSFALGFIALILGVFSLRRIKKHNESGQPMAWIGISLGGFIFLCILCFMVTLISVFMFMPDSIQPLIDSHSI